MQILFLILKIIGVLLGICVLLLAAVVAVPVRYRMKAEFDEEASGFAVFSWLLHIIDFRVRYEEKDVIFRLRIFGFPISLTEEEPSDGELTEEEPSDGKSAEEKPSDGKSAKEESSDGELTEEEPLDGELAKEESSDGELTEEEPLDRETPEELSGGKSPEETDASPTEITDESVDDRWRERISDRAKGAGNAKEKFQNIKNMISDETNKSAVRKIWRIFRYLVRHISPRKVSGELAFGMADPARTGQVLGVLSMIPFWARYKINVYPDFQTEHFFVQGKLQMRGHIRLWHFILSAIRLFIDKELRLVWRRIRK